MAVSVFIAATLRRYYPDYDPLKGISIEVPEGASVEELLKLLGIPSSEVKIIMVDGTHARTDTRLKGNERVALFPAVGGG
ncbi:MoaD/ThiS family protein [Thermodesulforhabdus norvegica]|uniref:Sulfur carrier protein ThiS (Thiamine biosynthesis) n=1 Tax=Thermodesulforhabdus norvegica TaxID=39841 RepID=A0A1I4V8L1_9BACT|nr:MoaD/ThiS family protein [Thermodesulforhabdus norvegica]SFM97340.1 Sulfur carrier protein ThiS (thiamine biosynthesis) [Thermodesulforhabdus norvegica]